MLIYCMETVSVYILRTEAVSVYILCLSTMPRYSDYWFSGTVCAAVLSDEAMAAAGRGAQPTPGAGGDRQRPLPTPPAATAAPQRLCAAAADTAAENRAAPSHSHAVLFLQAPAAHAVLQVTSACTLLKKRGGGQIRRGEGKRDFKRIWRDPGSSSAKENRSTPENT